MRSVVRNVALMCIHHRPPEAGFNQTYADLVERSVKFHMTNVAEGQGSAYEHVAAGASLAYRFYLWMPRDLDVLVPHPRVANVQGKLVE